MTLLTFVDLNSRCNYSNTHEQNSILITISNVCLTNAKSYHVVMDNNKMCLPKLSVIIIKGKARAQCI